MGYVSIYRSGTGSGGTPLYTLDIPGFNALRDVPMQDIMAEIKRLGL